MNNSSFKKMLVEGIKKNDLAKNITINIEADLQPFKDLLNITKSMIEDDRIAENIRFEYLEKINNIQ